jgi:hypothetical protein
MHRSNLGSAIPSQAQRAIRLRTFKASPRRLRALLRTRLRFTYAPVGKAKTFARVTRFSDERSIRLRAFGVLVELF